MVRKVFRYGPLEARDQEPKIIFLPVNAEIVHIDSKNDGYIDLWALVDEDATEHATARTFQLFVTGAPIPEDAQYVGTSLQGKSSVLQNGTAVLHVFERLVD